MIDVRLKVDWKELYLTLNALTPEKQTEILKPALKAGGDIIGAKATALAPAKTGALRRAIKVSSLKAKPGNAKVRIQVGKGAYKGDEYYAAFQEWGWKQGKRPRGGKTARANDTRKEIPGRHYMENAVVQAGEAAISKINEMVLDGIDKVLGSS